MSLFAWIASAAASAAGGFITAVCGFGLGPIMMSVMPYFMPYSRAVALVGICGMAVNLMIAFAGRREINWKNLLPCVAGGLLSSIAAVSLSVGAAEKVMVRALGAALIALSIYSVFFSGRLRIRSTPLNGVIAGIIAGTMTGLFSAGGPPIAIFMLASADNNNEYRSTLNAYFSIINVCAAVNRAFSGVLTPSDFWFFVQLLAALALGKWLGNKVFHRFDPNRLRKAVYAYLCVSGITMLLK